jgi:MYXO-CTERM domain-containing protein
MNAARPLVVAGALAGFLGVMLSAVARHTPGTMYLETAAQFLLFHGAALVGLAALLANGVVERRLGAVAGWGLVLGLVLFCGDLASRDFFARPLFAMAAPIGGTVMMVGWILLGAAGLWRRRRTD